MPFLMLAIYTNLGAVMHAGHAALHWQGQGALQHCQRGIVAVECSDGVPHPQISAHVMFLVSTLGLPLTASFQSDTCSPRS